MSIIYGIGTIKHPVAHKRNSKKFYYLNYRQAVRANSTVYKKDIDSVKPATPNGCVYDCISGGISGASPPTWGTVEGETTIDGDVEWLCRADDLEIGEGDAITVSTFTGTGCTIDNASISGNSTKFRLTAVPANATSVDIVNHITVVRANGDTEELETTLTLKVI